MKLETHKGVIADPAALVDIAPAIYGLIEVGDAYIILNDDRAGDETYVQAAGTVGEDFIVERRDGGAGDHYRGDRRVTAAELGTIFAGYLRGSADWSDVVTWHRVRVDMNAPVNGNA